MTRNNEFFIYIDGRLIDWDIWAPEHGNRGFTRYYSAVLREVDRHVTGCRFYITRDDVHDLPASGDRVVVLVYGDETFRVPAYATRVGHVFKTYGVDPLARYLRHPDALLQRLRDRPLRLNVAAGLRVTFNVMRAVPLRLRFELARLRAGITGAPMPRMPYPMQGGYHSSEPLPVVPILERSVDASFDGSVRHQDYPWWSPKYWLSPPKEVSRRALVSALQALQTRLPHRVIRVATTAGLTVTRDKPNELSLYSLDMMQTKICCVPRGTIAETNRLYEAMRYGCVIVTEPLPPGRWFFEGAPFVTIGDWREAGPVIESLLADPQRLNQLHQQTLAWWQSHGSEEACGRRIGQIVASHLAGQPTPAPAAGSASRV